MTLLIVMVPTAEIMVVAMTITSAVSRHCFLMAFLWEESETRDSLEGDRQRTGHGGCVLVTLLALLHAGSHAMSLGVTLFQQRFHCQQRRPPLPQSITSCRPWLGFFRGKGRVLQ